MINNFLLFIQYFNAFNFMIIFKEEIILEEFQYFLNNKFLGEKIFFLMSE